MDSIHDTEFCRKVLMREFERFFDGLSLDQVTTFAFADSRAQWHAWVLETLIWTCARIKEGALREALRGYAQAKEYRGRNGGFWPSGTISDCAVTIQNALEDKILPRGGN